MRPGLIDKAEENRQLAPSAPGRVRPPCSQSGLTLIEVLIAMVILLIGIYAVLKIFPAGFAVIEESRQRSVANSLAQGELERCKLLADNLYSLPEAIVATDNNGAPLTDYDPRDLTPAQTDPDLGAHPVWQPDSVFLPRTILGERTMIPAASGGQIPFYLLQFAPIADFVTGTTLQVYDANPFVRVTGTPGPRQYTVDNAAGAFTFVGYDNRYFTVTYSWLGTDGIVRNVIGESDQVASGGFTLKAKTDNPLLFQQVVPQSERVYLLYNATASDPPAASGEYYLDNTSLMTGKIKFSSADIGKAIGINYRVADWGILREDYEIPTNSSAVRVAVSGGIKGPGYTNPPRQTAEEKLPDSTNFVLAINLSDGITVYGDATSNASDHRLTVDYRAGAIRFPASATGTMRIFYRGQRDWIVQVQRAAASYSLGAAADYNTFRWPHPTDSDPKNRKILNFAPSEAGKTISLSYYRDVDVDGNGSFTDAGDIPHQYVTDELENIALDGTVTFCQPADNHVQPSALNSFMVKGVSLTARVVWAGGGKSTVLSTHSSSGRQEYLNEAWRQVRASALLTAPVK
jgi:prepilin-type N-terminal cleavage/methylation domain-containing protein